ncbi:hypothetical protein CEXT_604831 [Caerostris extrusa]|uniref:Uncharacterized protein n=1 Tax=Caerostris extrusa TaxID=172846 RepID=A0AAV4SPT8_CAEEX|nr:hypothetical protein CEXT_604831 [Caerostris extrusa]
MYYLWIEEKGAQIVGECAVGVKKLKRRIQVSHLPDFPVDDDLVPLVVVEPDLGGAHHLLHVPRSQLHLDGDPSPSQGDVQEVLGAGALQPHVGGEEEQPDGLSAAELQGHLVTPADQGFAPASPHVEVEVLLAREGRLGGGTLWKERRKEDG